MKEAEKHASDLFRFLRWLDPYIQPCKSISNLLRSPASQDNEESDEDDNFEDNSLSPDELRCCTPLSETSEISNASISQRRNCSDTSKSETTGQTKYRKKMKPAEDSSVHNAELELFRSFSSKIDKQTGTEEGKR